MKFDEIEFCCKNELDKIINEKVESIYTNILNKVSLNFLKKGRIQSIFKFNLY
jgi:hypothetical protein